MRKFTLLSAFFILAISSFSQTDTTKQGWRKGGLISINIGQGGSRNWAAGAEKWSVSAAGLLNLFANKVSGKWTWDNSLDISYAFVNTHSLGYRKTDDRLDFVSKAGYKLTDKLSIAGLVNFRSQFYYGFDYNYLNQGLKRRTSGFMAPAYLTVAPGLDWKPTKSLSIFVTPISARWTFVTDRPYDYLFQGGVIPAQYQTAATGTNERPKSVLYGVDPVRQVKFEAGGFASIAFNKDVFKNVTFKSRLDLFSNYLKGYTFLAPTYTQTIRTGAHPEKIDVYWTNTITMKVNKWLNVTYSLDMIYDDDVKQFGPNHNVAAAQFRTLLGVGFSTKF
ncbi:MAG TPA: DUF3078 domain-containing protein [Chitinophagaceae bacterium]|nr:DUF3078 domain-containing protein [Chitinophagaceae bacterium]